MNQWILAPESVSGKYDSLAKVVIFLEMERTFGRVDSDSVREPSDVTSFGNMTAFFIFPLSFQHYSTLKIICRLSTNGQDGYVAVTILAIFQQIQPDSETAPEISLTLPSLL